MNCDPLAVAIGNASLLGAGYVMLGRPRLAIGTGAATAALVVILASVGPPGWPWRAGLFLWWMALTLHGWHLAGGGWGRPAPLLPGRPGRDRTQRTAAIVVAGAVLLALLGLRVDAWRIDRDAAEAHRAGDCAEALSILDGLGAGHRVAYGSLAARARDGGQACELLVDAGRQATANRLLAAAATLETYGAHPAARWEGADQRRADLLLAQANDDLETALTGDLESLADGFGHLSTVLDEIAGREEDVDLVLDAFLGNLPGPEPCRAVPVTDWLAERPASEDVLDRSIDAARRVAPTAMLRCGDQHLNREQWQQARRHYRMLLDQYPDHELAGRAGRAFREAELGLELATVRALVDDESGGLPAYCDEPARYRGADPYRGGGPYRTLLFGDDHDRDMLPSSWLADDVADAVLVICADEVEYGSVVDTCDYVGGGEFATITFRARRVDIRVYELRTGDLLADTSVEIRGHCPTIVTFVDSPPSQRYVESTESDVRTAYRPIIDP
jgi:hypothetical protein